eukprot:2842977-Pleurochrysis_carterae.AAC.1
MAPRDTLSRLWREQRVADKLANAVRKVNDGLRTLLDVQLAVHQGSGDLVLTLTAIRHVLGEHEARE